MYALLRIESNESRLGKLIVPLLLVRRYGTVIDLDLKVVQFSEELIKKLSETQLTITNTLPPYAVRYKLINLLVRYGFSLVSQSSFAYSKPDKNDIGQTISEHEYVLTLPKDFHHETFPDIITKLSP
jgi:subtilase family serine protease